jgi:lysophospholipase L1-like esterase
MVTGIQQPAAPPPGAPAPITFSNQTIRMIVRTSIGGRRARVQFSNSHGTVPLSIGAAAIALRAKESDIVTGSSKSLTFNGKPSAWIPAGAAVYSDPLDFNVPANGDLAVSIHVPGETGPTTQHSVGLHTTYVSKAGNFVNDVSIDQPTTTQSWYFLSGVEVMAPATSSAIVTFGDSITDGTRSTPNTDNSWPSQFSRRLQAAGANVAVLNQGISGNRILRDGAGTNALARFDRDVLAMSGAKWVVLLEGINDIGQGNRAGIPETEKVTAEDVIAGMRQFADKAHAHGLQVIGGTLTPIEGSAYYNDSAETVRQAVNQWIRSSGTFDTVVDFDAATRDAASPRKFRAEFDSGDHLHPNDTGYKAMAEALNLATFGVAQK